jgi:hypothetical protein
VETNLETRESLESRKNDAHATIVLSRETRESLSRVAKIPSRLRPRAQVPTAQGATPRARATTGADGRATTRRHERRLPQRRRRLTRGRRLAIVRRARGRATRSQSGRGSRSNRIEPNLQAQKRPPPLSLSLSLSFPPLSTLLRHEDTPLPPRDDAPRPREFLTTAHRLFATLSRNSHLLTKSRTAISNGPEARLLSLFCIT